MKIMYIWHILMEWNIINWTPSNFDLMALNKYKILYTEQVMAKKKYEI
jgi:hypothetical protein